MPNGSTPTFYLHGSSSCSSGGSSFPFYTSNTGPDCLNATSFYVPGNSCSSSGPYTNTNPLNYAHRKSLGCERAQTAAPVTPVLFISPQDLLHLIQLQIFIPAPAAPPAAQPFIHLPVPGTQKAVQRSHTFLLPVMSPATAQMVLSTRHPARGIQQHVQGTHSAHTLLPAPADWTQVTARQVLTTCPPVPGIQHHVRIPQHAQSLRIFIPQVTAQPVLSTRHPAPDIQHYVTTHATTLALVNTVTAPQPLIYHGARLPIVPALSILHRNRPHHELLQNCNRQKNNLHTPG